MKLCRYLTIATLVLSALVLTASGQTITKELKVGAGQQIEIVNLYGRVDVAAIKGEVAEPKGIAAGSITATSNGEIADGEIVIAPGKGKLLITVAPTLATKRVDLVFRLPERASIAVETRDGGIFVAGNFEKIAAKSDTGTIAVDVPTDALSYDLHWTTSKPRYLADFTLDKIKERAAGRFQIKGRVGEKTDSKKKKKKTAGAHETSAEGNGEQEIEAELPKDVSLSFVTARGIVLINVPPNEVMSDLRERPLTNAAKAIVRSGDARLVDAVRRASPRYFGDYAKTLPPAAFEPTLTLAERPDEASVENVKTVTARVVDVQNRAIAGLTADDLDVTESGESREILSVKPVTAPVNLVLLLDVSGSVDNYVNFIRKAARAFVSTVDARDRVSIVLFNDDVNVLADFTTDKRLLSASLDTFDAGGGTAYYDAIGYTLSETLRPLKGDRTAIVILTDGDDNRSFLPFDSLAGSIQESGALIYPLYVPTSLAALGAEQDWNSAVDPLRARYLNTSLTSKAEAEGARLAQISGGVYYPISELAQIQKAYEDIVQQLRTAYTVTFRSSILEGGGRLSPRLKIRSKRPNTFVQISR